MNWSNIKSGATKAIIGIITVGIFTLIPFYYYTNYTLAQHSEKINNLSKEVKNLNDTIRDNEQTPIVIQGEIKVIKKDIENIKENQQRQET